jgi:hypothetical protein
MIEKGATHVGVATDHVIESFRNDLWPDYKTGDGIERALWAQFHPLEDALSAMGVAVWPMIELEADDALASATRIAAEDRRAGKSSGRRQGRQCVEATASCGSIAGREDRDAAGVREVRGRSRGYDFLALVGDATDGYQHRGDRQDNGGTALEPARRDRALSPGSARRPT